MIRKRPDWPVVPLFAIGDIVTKISGDRIGTRAFIPIRKIGELS